VQFYCLHALADGNQCIWIREKMLLLNSIIYTVSIPEQKFRKKITAINK